jgi:hypothetical protein
MTFRFAPVQMVRSESQRALAHYWDQLAAGRPFPSFTEFQPDPAIHDPKQLVVWNIEGAGRLLKFRARYQGENVADAFNTAWVGETMEEVVPMSLRRPALDAAKECADSGCMVYMVLSTWDSSATRIDCERLLLPFGNNGKVEQLLGSLQLTNVPNASRRKGALSRSTPRSSPAGSSPASPSRRPTRPRRKRAAHLPTSEGHRAAMSAARRASISRARA